MTDFSDIEIDYVIYRENLEHWEHHWIINSMSPVKPLEEVKGAHEPGSTKLANWGPRRLASALATITLENCWTADWNGATRILLTQIKGRGTALKSI